MKERVLDVFMYVYHPPDRRLSFIEIAFRHSTGRQTSRRGREGVSNFDDIMIRRQQSLHISAVQGGLALFSPVIPVSGIETHPIMNYDFDDLFSFPRSMENV